MGVILQALPGRMQATGSLANLTRHLPDGWHAVLFGIAMWQYCALGVLFLLGLLSRQVLHFVMVSRMKRLSKQLAQAWVASLVDVVASPGATLVMALLLGAGYPLLNLAEGPRSAIAAVVKTLVALAITWAAYRLVDVLAHRMAERAAGTESRLDDQLVPLLRKTLKVGTVIAGGLFILQNLRIDVGSLLTGLGIGGLAFALAAKDTIANFFGSFMIFVDRPFQIGDWIVAGGAEGVVEEVGFRSTRIRTFYNSLVTLPNATFTETKIDNYGARRYRRTSTTLNLTYETSAEQMQAFVEGARAVIEANPHTRKDYYEVHMSGFGSHSLDVMLYFFFEVADWSDELRERHNVFLELLRLAESLKISFAFPTQTLHVDSVRAAGEPSLRSARPSDPELARVVRDYGPGGALSRPSGPKLPH